MSKSSKLKYVCWSNYSVNCAFSHIYWFGLNITHLALLSYPNSEFVNNYNLRCTVDILADEIVATEIDQEESDSTGEDLPGDILRCDDHPRCAYYTGHSSIYETVETQFYVCNKSTTKKGCITSYFNVCFTYHAKGNHKRHIKHMTMDVIINLWTFSLPDYVVPRIWIMILTEIVCLFFYLFFKISFWIGMYTDLMSYASPNKWYIIIGISIIVCMTCCFAY